MVESSSVEEILQRALAITQHKDLKSLSPYKRGVLAGITSTIVATTRHKNTAVLERYLASIENSLALLDKEDNKHASQG